MRTFLYVAVALLYPLTSEHATAPLKPPVFEPLSQRAPLFAYRSLDGNLHRLSGLKGKVVVIDFWRTWCPGCVEEMPSLQRLYEGLGTSEAPAWKQTENGLRVTAPKGIPGIPEFGVVLKAYLS